MYESEWQLLYKHTGHNSTIIQNVYQTLWEKAEILRVEYNLLPVD